MRTAAVRSFALLGATALVIACVLWGQSLNRRDSRLLLDAPPFVGHWTLRIGPRTLAPVVVAAVVIGFGPQIASRVRWGRVLGLMVFASILWVVSLALTDGVDGLHGQLLAKDDYLRDVPRVTGLTGFLSHFTEDINTYGGPHPWTTHVSGHPPGLLLLLAGMAKIGLGGIWPAAVLYIVSGCAASVAVLITVREIVGEDVARRAAPYLTLLPAAIWIGVSADAFFLGMSASAIALLTVGAHRGRDGLSLAGGIVFGLCLFLSYGFLTMAVLAVAVIAVTRRVRPLLLAGLGVLCVVALFAVLGFWWVEGLHETLIRYRAGAGGYRPYSYFLFANLAVLAVAVGPAALAGLSTLRARDRLWWIVGPAVMAVALADLSGDSKAEVERIWLPFVPWIVLGAARLERPRLWLALQGILAIVFQSVLLSKW